MKKSELRMMIREIVREEVALTMKEVIKEIVGGGSGNKQQIKPKPKPKYYSKNKVLNAVLHTFGFLKFPAPAMQYTNGNILFHPIYY